MQSSAQVKDLQNLDMVFERIIGLVNPLAEHSLIYCDFNEFNIIVLFRSKYSGIFFPICVSILNNTENKIAQISSSYCPYLSLPYIFVMLV